MLKNFFSGAATSDAGAVAHEEFAQAVDGGHVLVVDVREPREFAAGRIPGAVNMPMSRFDPQELPSGRPVVLICQAGGRSCNALSQARAAGRDDVQHYPAGMNGWRARGGNIEV